MSTQSKGWTVGPAARRLLAEGHFLLSFPKTSARREVKELKKLFEQHGSPAVDAQLSKWMGRGFKPRESVLGTPLAKGVAGSEGAYYPVIGQADAPYGIVSGRKVNHGVMGKADHWLLGRVPMGVPPHLQQMRMDGWRAVDSNLPEGVRLPKLYGARKGQGNSQHLAVEHIQGKMFDKVKGRGDLPHIAPDVEEVGDLFAKVRQQRHSIPGWSDKVAVGDLHGGNIMIPADRSGFVIVDPALYRPGHAADGFNASGVRWSDKYVAQVAGGTGERLAGPPLYHRPVQATSVPEGSLAERLQAYRNMNAPWADRGPRENNAQARHRRYQRSRKQQRPLADLDKREAVVAAEAQAERSAQEQAMWEQAEQARMRAERERVARNWKGCIWQPV